MKLYLLLTLSLALGCQQPPAPKKPAPLLPDPVTKSDVQKISAAIEHTEKHQTETLSAINRLASAIENQPKPESITKADLEALSTSIHDTLHEHLDAKTEEAKHEPPPAEPVAEAEAIHPPKAPPAEMPDASNFTGIRLNIGSVAKERAMGFPCVPCREAVHAVQRLANYSVGYTPDNDIWIVPVDEGVTPVWEIVIDGEVVDSKEGYKSEWNVQKILRRHPKFSKRSMLTNRAAPVSGCAGAFAAPPDCATPTFAVPDCATPMMAAPDCAGPVYEYETSPDAGKLPPSMFRNQQTGQWEMRHNPWNDGPVLVRKNPNGTRSYPIRRTNPLAKVPPGTPHWGHAGRSLKGHLMGRPHHYSSAYLDSIGPRGQERLHSGEHELHARRTGVRAPYFPGRSGPFYGSLQGNQQRYASRAPRRRGYGMGGLGGMMNGVGQLGMMAAPFLPLAIGF